MIRSIRVEYERDRASRADKAELMGMSISDQSEGKWIKMGQVRIEK